MSGVGGVFYWSQFVRDQGVRVEKYTSYTRPSEPLVGWLAKGLLHGFYFYLCVYVCHEYMDGA